MSNGRPKNAPKTACVPRPVLLSGTSDQEEPIPTSALTLSFSSSFVPLCSAGPSAGYQSKTHELLIGRYLMT